VKRRSPHFVTAPLIAEDIPPSSSEDDTLVFSLSKPVSITAASGAGEMGALTLGGADAQAVQKWIFDHRYISLK